jgi:hypothetical protein
MQWEGAGSIPYILKVTTCSLVQHEWKLPFFMKAFLKMTCTKTIILLWLLWICKLTDKKRSQQRCSWPLPKSRFLLCESYSYWPHHAVLLNIINVQSPSQKEKNYLKCL